MEKFAVKKKSEFEAAPGKKRSPEPEKRKVGRPKRMLLEPPAEAPQPPAKRMRKSAKDVKNELREEFFREFIDVMPFTDEQKEDCMRKREEMQKIEKEKAAADRRFHESMGGSNPENLEFLSNFNQKRQGRRRLWGKNAPVEYEKKASSSSTAAKLTSKYQTRKPETTYGDKVKIIEYIKKILDQKGLIEEDKIDHAEWQRIRIEHFPKMRQVRDLTRIRLTHCHLFMWGG